MPLRPRSLRHEYELYVDREIENYKESVPRRVILGIGDEAVQALAAQRQLALTEILLCAEVDRIVCARLRLPSYATWRKRRLKALKDFARPERWGILPGGAVARAAAAGVDGHVLVAGAEVEGPALYLAAHGCAVTALDPAADVLERVIDAATAVGLTGRLRGFVADLATWAPDTPLDVVICAANALATLSPAERIHAIALLQEATTAGGVHLVELHGDARGCVPFDELAASYGGWQISVEPGLERSETFLARKAVA